MRTLRLLAAIFITLGLTACGAAKATVMPEAVGKQLDVAKSDIKRAGFAGEVEVLGGGIFGIVEESNWTVCEQLPSAGTVVTEAPRLTVDRSCDGTAPEPSERASEEPSEQPSVEPSEEPSPDDTATAGPAPEEVKATKTTLEKLVNRLNSSKMGGIKNGDLFRVIVETIKPEMWFTSVYGDFVVLVKDPDGKRDREVLAEESAAEDWDEGTMVEMVLEIQERVLDGSPQPGYMVVVSAETLP